MLDFEKDDKVRIDSERYGPLDEQEAVVTAPYSTGFRVQVHGFEIVIADPATELEFVTFGKVDAENHLEALASMFDGHATIQITDGKVEVEIDERLFLKAFGDDGGYQAPKHSYDSPLHMTTAGTITYVTRVSYGEEREKADAWLAAHRPDPAEAKVDQAEPMVEPEPQF